MTAVEAQPARRSARPLVFGLVLTTVVGLLFGVPWWTLVRATELPGVWAGLASAVFLAAAIGLPVMMMLGHGSRGLDWASRIGDTTLGLIWVLFSWSVIGNVAGLGLGLAGVADPLRSRIVAAGVVTVAFGLSVWGIFEAMRVPRVKRLDVVLERLGPGLDGTTVALITDTHYGPIDRTRWATRVAAKVNELEADIVCHTGDIADGTVDQRRGQVATLGDIRARYARAYVTGNHEYYGGQDWLSHMASLGWQALHNRHLIVERGGDRLVVAGIDDHTARTSDLKAALAGAEPGLPVLLLAHQPKQVALAASAGVDLQLSGHTHGGQIWPFHYLVKTDQPAVAGLSHHGERTRLYTSRGTGFWGPPLRVFAPSEITLLTLRSA